MINVSYDHRLRCNTGPIVQLNVPTPKREYVKRLPSAEGEDTAPRALNMEKINSWPLRIDFESTAF